jgi:GT2 family glycosyltransferase
MSNSGTIGVVTVTYNSGQVLDGFLHSLIGQTRSDFILYAVDNASRDNTLMLLKAWGDTRLRMIPNESNLGVAEANNQGTRAALAEGCNFVLYLNNDVEFEPDTFSTLVAELDEHGCDLLAPKILFEDGVHIWSAGSTFNALKGYLGAHIGEGEIDCGQFDMPRLIRNAPTCCLLSRAAVFDKIGMMDANYFVYHDDSDFLFRAWRAGLTMFYTPRARILHKVSSLTGGSKSVFTIRYNARGHVYFMLKNLGIARCLFYLPALQLRMVMKVLLRYISWDEFVVRERAFIEGISVWLSRQRRQTT